MRAKASSFSDLSGTHGTGFSMVASPKEVAEGTMNALGAAVAVLGAKAPGELDALPWAKCSTLQRQ